MAENFSNDFQTTLAAPIANGSVSAISVVSATGAPAVNFRIRVGNELMLVTSKGSGTDWTVTRGIEGTTASAHVSGTLLVHVVTTGGLQQYITDQLTGGTVAANFASLVVAGTLTARWNINSSGHLLAGTDNTYDIGAFGATRPRQIHVGSYIVSPLCFIGSGSTTSTVESGGASGVLLLRNNAQSGFNRIQLGGTTSSFPALKRSTTELHARLADDSAFTYLQAKLRASDGTAGANFSGAVTNITVVDGVVTAAS